MYIYISMSKSEQDIFDQRANGTPIPIAKKNNNNVLMPGVKNHSTNYYIGDIVTNSNFLIYKSVFWINELKNGGVKYYDYYRIDRDGRIYSLLNEDTDTVAYSFLIANMASVGSIYDNVSDKYLLIPTDSTGWLWSSELNTVTTGAFEQLTGATTTDFNNGVPFNHYSTTQYTPGGQSVGWHNAQQYYKDRQDYSYAGTRLGLTENYDYPCPPINLLLFSTDAVMLTYPSGGIYFNQYYSDSKVIKDYNIYWTQYSDSPTNYNGEKYEKSLYRNDFLIDNVDKNGQVYVNGNVFLYQNQNSVKIPFNAKGLLFIDEFNRIKANNDTSVYKSLTGVDFDPTFVPNSTQDSGNGDGGDNQNGTTTPPDTCKTSASFFKDRNYGDPSITRYVYDNANQRYSILINPADYPAVTPFYYKFSNMYDLLYVYDYLYFTIYDNKDLLYRFVKMDNKGNAYGATSTSPLVGTKLSSVQYSSTSQNVFDPNAKYKADDIYIPTIFYGAIFIDELNYFVDNRTCNDSFGQLTYQDISDINNFQKFKVTVAPPPSPPDDNPPEDNPDDTPPSDNDDDDDDGDDNGTVDPTEPTGEDESGADSAYDSNGQDTNQDQIHIKDLLPQKGNEHDATEEVQKDNSRKLALVGIALLVAGVIAYNYQES